MKNLKSFTIILLLTLGVGQMWGGDNCDFLHKESDDVWIKYVTDAGTTQKNLADDGESDISLGSITNLSISEFRAITKKHNGNVCHVKMYYGINTSRDGSRGSNVQASYNNNGYGDWTWDNYWAVQQFKNTSVGIDLIRNRKPGSYYFDFEFAINGNSGGTSGCYDDQKWWSNGGGHYHISYTIPDPTITITGVNSLVVGTSTNIQATISNYPVGATLTKVQVSGNIASTKSNTGTGSSVTVSSVVPNASGSNGITVKVTVTYGSAGTKDYTYNYNVSPSAVSGFTITPSGAGYVTGSGTSASPYMMKHNAGDLVLTISGSQASSDANSAAQYYNGSSWGTTATKTIAYASGSTTKQSVTLKMRYKNNSTALYGAESSKTVYYQRESAYNVKAVASPAAGGTVTPTSNTSSGQYSGCAITASNNTGYTFGGWSGGTGTFVDASSANTTFKPTATSTVTATFNETMSTVSFVASPSGKGTFTVGGSTVTSTEAGVTTTKSVTAVPISGYRFTGWSITGGATISSTTDNPTTITGGGAGTAATLTATFEEDLHYYDVTFGVGTSYTSLGSLSAKVTSTSAAITSGDDLLSGTGITFTASPNTGYEVAGFYSDASCNTQLQSGTSTTYTIVSLSSDVTVYVKYVEKIWSVNFAAGTGGSVTTPNSSPRTVGQVTGISIAATPSTGYTWNTWTITSGSGSFTSAATTNSNTFKPTAASTITASFNETMHTVTKNSCTGSTSVGIATAATVTCNNAASGKKFDRWTITGAYTLTSGTLTSRTISFTATTDVTVTATYVDRSYKKVYFAKPSSWSSGLKVYAWDGKGTPTYKNAAWPGVEITTTETVSGTSYYYYKFYTDNNGEGDNQAGAANWVKLIFSHKNNEGTKTADLTLADGHYYHVDDGKAADDRGGKETATVSGSASPADWYVTGYFNGSNDWGYAHPITISTNTGSTTVGSLTLNSTQYVKIYRASTNQWFKWTGGASTDYYDDKAAEIGSEMVMREYNHGSNYFTSTLDEYRFSLDVTSASNPKLTISPATDNDFSATLSVNSFGHGSTSPTAGAITLHQYTPTSITAIPEAGYRFKQWNVSGVSCSSTTSATATFTTSASGGTIEAEFTQDGIIYFDNTMSQWKGDIYVYLFTNSGTNPWWNDKNNGNGPGIVLKRADNSQVLYNYYGKMTRINNTNYYYFDYHAAGCSGTIYKVVFTKGDFHTSSGLYQTSAAYRTQFDACFPMYMASQNWSTTNSTGYHSTGYWKKYNVTVSGFDIRGLNNDWTADLHPFTSTTPNSNTFKTKVTLNNATHAFKIYRCSGNPLGNTGTMSPTNHAGWEMTETSDCHIYAPSGGEYEFTINLGSDHIYLSVEYPLLQNDYRLLHTGRITTTGLDSHKHPSQSVRHLTGNNNTQKDTVSFWIDASHKGTMNLQYCTNPAANDGKGAWANVTSGGNPVTVSLSSISETGIYNFVITQTTNGSGTRTVTVAPLAENFKYDGELYIRTDASDGGWEAYKFVDNNKLEYSEWARDHSGYDYYHCYFAGTGCNVHFTIANKYSPSLTDTLKTDDIVTSGNLPYQCNVRFMYTSSTNKIGRAYLNGSSETGENEFLVLQGASSGARIKDTNGSYFTDNKTKLGDNGNWIYNIDIQADETARVKLISNYRFDKTDHNQYFIGTSAAWSDASTAQILGGDDPSSSHTIRIVYDYKTNHLLSAWLADGTDVNSQKEINTSIMIMREHQNSAKQITFSGTGKLTDVGTVYSVMQFNKWTTNNKSKTGAHATLSPAKSHYEREFYWISFPFDVKLNDVFGFGEYGVHWIIEYYDGKGRAANGYWAESPVNWKFVYPYMKDDYVLKANEGYVLALDLEEMTESSHVWDYVEDVYLYFPSASEVGSIVKKNVTVDFNDQNEYLCSINRTVNDQGNPTGLGPEYDRRVRDSYWHCIGVPSFANNSNTVKHDGWEDGDPWDIADIDAENWSTATLPYYYAWNQETNQLFPYSTGGSFTFEAMKAYLVQYSQNTMSWTNASTPSAASIVGRRKARLEDIHFAEFKLDVMDGSQSLDHTYVRLTDNEDATAAFEFGQDLCKEFKSGANIYTMIDQLEVAGNSLPLDLENTTLVPVGVKLTANGEYTFAMPEGTNGIGVVLIDNVADTRTNLALENYTVEMTAGTINDRFVLEISPVKNTATSVENTASGVQNTDTRKVMVDGLLYIVKDDKVFDARGQRVE